jgi:23S rRNA (uridine2552-2'-O)-methyltransferase
MVKRFNPRDRYARKATEEGYLARSAFKLQFISERFPVLRPRFRVLDLGAAPGSWMQVASGIVGPKGIVVGVDINPIMFSAPNVVTMSADILASAFGETVAQYAPFDTVLSDAAPSTTGIRERDQAASMELVEGAVAIARWALKRRGVLVAKAFECEEMHTIMKLLRAEYDEVRAFKPPASRDRSYETFIIALGKRAQAEVSEPRQSGERESSG